MSQHNFIELNFRMLTKLLNILYFHNYGTIWEKKLIYSHDLACVTLSHLT